MDRHKARNPIERKAVPNGTCAFFDHSDASFSLGDVLVSTSQVRSGSELLDKGLEGTELAVKMDKSDLEASLGVQRVDSLVSFKNRFRFSVFQMHHGGEAEIATDGEKEGVLVHEEDVGREADVSVRRKDVRWDFDKVRCDNGRFAAGSFAFESCYIRPPNFQIDILNGDRTVSD
jgi:hypothetical protein